MIETYLSFSLVGLISLLFYSLASKFLNFKKDSYIVSNFESYEAVLQYIMKQAYEIIYKDRLVVYSLEAMKVDEKILDVCSKDFANLVLKMMGPRLQKQLTYVYGNEETLLFNVLQFFNDMYERDEIRRKQQERLMETEETEEPAKSEEQVKNVV